MIEEYHQFIKQARESIILKGTITLQDLLSRSELLHIEESVSGNEELENLVLDRNGGSCDLLKQMRVAEGEELKKDLLTPF